MQAPPHSRLAVEREGESIVFKPMESEPQRKRPEDMTPAERWDGLLAWAEKNRTPAGIPLEALLRENLYDD